MSVPQPIYLIDKIKALDDLLIRFLDDLSPEDWHKPTLAGDWKVKDIALHLLDGNMRTISMFRDGYFVPPDIPIHTYQELVSYLNRLNAEWLKATQRLSTRVIIDLLKSSGAKYYECLRHLDPKATAAFSVAWAGETESQNWFHIAREYTEKWHHQQQMRLAIGSENVLLKERWYQAYIDTSVRALPYHYKPISGSDGDVIKFTFRGTIDKTWYLQWTENQWSLLLKTTETPTAEVIINDDIAWRIFTKGIDKKEAIDQSHIIGDRTLGVKIFDMIAVMA